MADETPLDKLKNVFKQAVNEVLDDRAAKDAAAAKDKKTGDTAPANGNGTEDGKGSDWLTSLFGGK